MGDTVRKPTPADLADRVQALFRRSEVKANPPAWTQLVARLERMTPEQREAFDSELRRDEAELKITGTL